MIRKVPFHRSLIRARIFLGGEARLVKASILIAGLVFISGMSLTSFIGAVILWFSALTILIHLAKNDPQMSLIYQRSLQYQSYYPARSGVFVLPKRINSWS